MLRATAGPVTPARSMNVRLHSHVHAPLLLFAAALLAGCVDTKTPGDAAASHRAPLFDVTATATTQAGDALPGTDPGAFAAAQDAFVSVENINDGLGPVFNDRACGACHTTPAIGGSGAQTERRFGRAENGVFFGYDRAPDNEGGTLRQLFSNGTYYNGANVCTIPVETEPASATVNNVGRRTQPLFGLGLVDAMPDGFFDYLAANEPIDVRGRVNRVSVVLPDPRDPTQFIGSTRVARFGWKGGVPSLITFAADAYDNEMGITTQSCFQGQTIVAFAKENFPNNVGPGGGCNGGDLAPQQPAHADVPRFTDDAVGPCAGKTEIQEDLVLFTKFMESLAPPPRDLSDAVAVATGKPIFAAVGCANCHTQTTFVTPPHPFNGVPGNYAFQPFSDFLLHDMGQLGDRIGATGDAVPTTRLMRTQPLWGARFNTNFLHDGRSPTLRSAIQEHGGQAADARRAFNDLGDLEQRALLQYVRSL